MSKLFAESAFSSIVHSGEEICGDHVDIFRNERGCLIAVLADGLGSGVKAGILSTLTSKMISTMISARLPIEECVRAMADTLPVTREHGAAYSTFTIMHVTREDVLELIEYDNPQCIFIRNGELFNYPRQEYTVDEKTIYKSLIPLMDGDMIIAISDGCPYAGPDNEYNNNWSRDDIADYMLSLYPGGFTPSMMAGLLTDVCMDLYEGEPRDDATALVTRIRKRTPVNILFGPPSNRDECNRMMNLFFSKRGKHIICGGTTASIAADWLGKPVIPISSKDDGPPMSMIEGVDIVTEGILTVSEVVSMAKKYLEGGNGGDSWFYKKGGAAQIAKCLFDEATDISFYAGRAYNPAHQDTAGLINYEMKMNLVQELKDALVCMGKSVTLSYF